MDELDLLIKQAEQERADILVKLRDDYREYTRHKVCSACGTSGRLSSWALASSTQTWQLSRSPGSGSLGRCSCHRRATLLMR